MTSRRTFLSALAAAAALPVASKLSLAAEAHRFTGDYGLQLYSLRRQLAHDSPGTLKTIRQDGYTEVEAAGLYGHTPEEFRGYLDQAGLKCTGTHLVSRQLREHFDDCVRQAKALGVEYVVCAVIEDTYKIPLTLNNYRAAAKDFNAWATRLRDAGLRFGYHNHDYEFRLLDGRPGLDTLIEQSTPGLVDFEMDVFWVKRGGQDPVTYLKRYPDRFRLMHLKDMRQGTPVGDFSVGTSDEDCLPLGEGILDIKGILRTAAEIGVRKYYVEDESREAPEGIRKSLEYLKTVRF